MAREISRKLIEMLEMAEIKCREGWKLERKEIKWHSCLQERKVKHTVVYVPAV